MKTNRSTWTEEQNAAIVARDVSVSLSAGAGCGKTFVLTERFLSHLEPNGQKQARLGQLVAITFTERAAREMRDRIRSTCYKRLIDCAEAEVDYWMELLRELDSARISTFHSFCGSFLRNHAVEAGLDPRFRVMDQAQADTLLTELTGDYLRNKLADEDESVLDLIVRYGLNGLKDMIAYMLKRRQDIDWNYWRAMSAEQIAANWQVFFNKEALPRMLQRISDLPAAHTVLEIARQKPSDNAEVQRRHAVLLDILPDLSSYINNSDAATVLADLREATMLVRSSKSNVWSSEELHSQYKVAVQELRKTIDAIKDRIVFDKEKAMPAADVGLRVLLLADGIGQAYNDAKRELAVLDFNDLLIFTKQLLADQQHQSMRKKWASHLKLLLVDEFQDTDPLQVELVKALCDNKITRGKLFFVGDFKQSIYRFRGADPDVFRQLRGEIPEKGKLSLSLNFRSQPAILDFVNLLFCEEFKNYQPLRAHRPQVSPLPAVEFIWSVTESNEEKNNTVLEKIAGNNPLSTAQAALLASSEEESDDQKPAERRRRQEADWIARRLRGLLDSKAKIVWDKDAAKVGKPAARAAEMGDIALLFRALTDVEYYEEALRRYGIDYYLVGGHAFYAQQEVFDLLHLLRALESPCDQLSLLGVLRSPFFNLHDETIFWLTKNNNNKGDISAGLFAESLPLQLIPEQRKQAVFAAKTLCELRALKDRLPIAKLINMAIERTGYDAVLLAEFLGERKLANLYKLIEQARSFDQSGMFTLSDFIAQLSEFVSNPPDEPLAATQSETMNVVRLMTIHQSKGLEFPVVVVPDISRPLQPSKNSVAFDSKLGPLVKDDEATVGYDLFSVTEKEEAEAEIYRLFYVAATRAADYLILSTGLDKPQKYTGPWMELLAKRFNMETGSLLQVDGGNYQVKVTSSRPELEVEPSSSRERQSLKKLLESTDKKIEKGNYRLPKYLSPIPPDATALRQFSFSRLSGSLQEKPIPSIVSALDINDSQEPVLNPLDRGTLVHAVLAEIDYKKPGSIIEIVRRHAELHSIDAEVDLQQPIALIERFLSSARSKKIAEADALYRELEFLLAWPPDDPRPNGKYLQGFIDCIYRDTTGGWHIVDYKTNEGVTLNNIQQKAAPYEMQMLVYALAAEKIFKTPPIDLALHFIHSSLEYTFPWNEQAKNRIIDMINQNLS